MFFTLLSREVGSTGVASDLSSNEGKSRDVGSSSAVSGSGMYGDVSSDYLTLEAIDEVVGRLERSS